jgi:hypothetical protein
MNIKSSLLVLAICAWINFACQSSLAQKSSAQLIVEESKPLPPPAQHVLGTIDYRPTAQENPFFERLGEEDRRTGDIMQEYSLQNKTGKYVSWCGIVRTIKNDFKALTTTATVEMKFFDGSQDSHMMSVDWHGDGDFTVDMNTCVDIPLLSLIRVYGKVNNYKNGIPNLNAEYIRIWPWGLFNFMNLSEHGDNHWTKLSKVDEKDIYSAYPNFKYYSDRLGTPPKSQRFIGFSQPDKPDSITNQQIRASGNPLDLYITRALDRLDNKYLDGTITDTTEAIKLDKNCSAAYGIRAMAEREKGLYQAALADVNFALMLNPLSHASYSTRGQIYSCLEDHQSAIKDFSKAIELKPTFHTRYLARAEAFEALGKYQEAIDDYNRYLQIEPNAKRIQIRRDKLAAKLKTK